jgi:hypothetical protein
MLLLLLLLLLSLFCGFASCATELLLLLLAILWFGLLLLLRWKFELLQHLYQERLLPGRTTPLQASFPRHFVSRLRRLILQSGLGCVNRESIIHPIEVQVFFDHVCHETAVLALVHFLCRWVLPLETRCLLGCRLGLLLDCFEHTRSELGTQGSQSTLIFQGLNHQVFQIVHIFA